uniref:Uncharacterized protein n=1 Tax=Fusarium oxysporum (strain Fo5176) TaxID=660025 RepID=A0A0D2Y5X6_FUSOF
MVHIPQHLLLLRPVDDVRPNPHALPRAPHRLPRNAHNSISHTVAGIITL